MTAPSTSKPVDTKAGIGHVIATRLARWRLPLLALVALAQAAVLMHIVWQRETLLKHGREITLDVVPVDPRSLFRGDYVILSYAMSRLPQSLFADGPRLRPGDRVAVLLRKAGEDWQAVAAGTSAAPPKAANANEVVVAGRVSASFVGLATADDYLVSYGIESFFVPEGSGREIERDVATRKVKAHVAIGSDGEAALRAITVDGERLDVPPLL